MNSTRRAARAIAAFVVVVVLGTAGYFVLGFGLLDALYQTVTTITTVGFREVQPLDSTGQIFTIVLILCGFGTALYAFGLVLETLLEGHLQHHLERRRMRREIARMTGHVIVCGFGRAGHAVADYLVSEGRQLVVVDRDQERLQNAPYAAIVGDVTDDEVLIGAGIERAQALIAALDSDADNVYVTLSSRALRPDLVIIARARADASKAKLIRAGADRAVNPQLIGGRRMGAFALQPHVAEFLDVVMHDETLDYRIEQFELTNTSPVAGKVLANTSIQSSTGAKLLALRSADGRFLTNPPADTRLEPQSVLIMLGTAVELAAVRQIVGGASASWLSTKDHGAESIRHSH
ncbi:potassium channel protein [Antrihabitans sp. YC2-6]|nr:potassium channel protein [Antrihabitans sp. YC2-6]MBJ8347009.1 potassium channel protein [Antrihabitans sp. YC2-6]